MGCLGSRMDTNYAVFLAPRIAEAIIGAAKHLQPARIGWGGVDDWEHTFNRRWIRRPDKMLTDPFGVQNVRAHMHPGHESPDAVGPSGPVDPGLSVLAVQSPEGRPIALLANYPSIIRLAFVVAVTTAVLRPRRRLLNAPADTAPMDSSP